MKTFQIFVASVLFAVSAANRCAGCEEGFLCVWGLLCLNPCWWTYCSEGETCTAIDGAGVCQSSSDQCTTSCGNPVEGGFRDEGDNWCNGCGCQENGNIFCTLIACDELPGGNDCGRFEGMCETECGNRVGNGVRFNDEGSNFCNSCVCVDGEITGCTEAACNPDAPEAECTGAGFGFCQTTCGKLVSVGLSFTDDGSNWCNSCNCLESGAASCTRIACDPDAEEAVCS